MKQERGQPSLRASLGVAAAIIRICSPTVVEASLGRLTRENIDRRMRWWGEAIRKSADIDFVSAGLAEVPTDETFVMMSNHESLFDVPMIYRAVPRTIRMVTKKELFRIPLWGRALRQSGFFEMDRDNRERAVETLRGAAKVLSEGINVWISPEGRRPKHATGLGPFKKGGFMLAIEAGARILPIGISGTREILPPGAARARTHGKVAVVIGKPIEVVGRDRESIIAETRAAIEALVAEARALRAGLSRRQKAGLSSRIKLPLAVGDCPMIGVNTKTITRLRDHLLVEGSRKSIFMAGAEALEHPLEGDDEAKEVLDAVAEAMYLMISADGKIEDAEREVLRGALRELTVGAMRSALIEQLLNGFEEAKQKEGQEARMNAIASVLCERPEAAEAAFVLSAAVAFADNEIADEENDVLNGFAEKLGISNERAEELLDGLEADGSEMVPELEVHTPLLSEAILAT